MLTKYNRPSWTDAFNEDSDKILIRSPSYVMCNYYKCNIKVFDKVFQSSEQAYQWRFVNHLGLEDFAQEIMNSSTTHEATEIASRVPHGQHKDWHSIKCQVMKEILRAKSDYSPFFRLALLNSVGKQIVESTQDLFWASGLPPRYSASTKSEYYPGKNKLGHTLEQLRNDLIKEGITSQLLDTTNTKDQIYVSQTGNSSDDIVVQQSLLATTTPPVDMPADNCDLKTQYDQLLTPSTSVRDPIPILAFPLNDETVTSLSPLTKNKHYENEVDVQLERDPLVKKSSVSEIKKEAITPPPLNLKKKNIKKLTPKESTGDNKTIVSMFDAMKRKLTPDKEADTTRNNQKVQRNEDYYES